MTDQTPAAQTSEPRTAAGRRLLEDLEGLHQPQKALRRILAIEAEAAALPAQREPTPELVRRNLASLERAEAADGLTDEGKGRLAAYREVAAAYRDAERGSLRIVAVTGNGDGTMQAELSNGTTVTITEAEYLAWPRAEREGQTDA